jgi:PAP2 superfamily
MTVAEASEPVSWHRRLPGARPLRDGTRLYWWAEVAFVGVFYFVYSAIRNANQGGKAAARHHAYQLMDIQRSIGINHERLLQKWALEFKPLIIACNYFYGSLHFVVTSGVMVFLYRKWSDDYPLWRNTLAIATALALIGFTFWPLMPPRLLPHHFGFVDTLDKDPAFWSFKQGAVNKISNQFAAMPSVHCCWALWCALALRPRLKHTWAKWLATLYPVGTVTAIVLTGNHYLLDAVGGFAILGLGYLLARIFTRAGRGSRDPAMEPPPSPPPSAVVA